MLKHYFTPERLEALKQEVKELKTKKRAEVSERLKRAKEYGDLSENSEYSEAKDEQAQLEARIYELEDTIKKAVLIPKTSGKETVEIGSTLVVEKNGQKISLMIVGSNEAKPDDGKISNESPLGKALLGKKVGEIAPVKAPSGSFEYKVVSIN